MIDPELYAGFVAAVTLLMLLPGPNVALIVANGVARGTGCALLTVIGTTAAMVPQLALASLGLSGLLAASAAAFDVLRWIGVAYLLWLGWRQWTAPAADLSAVRADTAPPLRIVLRAFAVSATNPKTLFFYGAFFPQFVSAALPIAPQTAVLAATFLALAATIDGGWAVLAGRARRLIAARSRLRNRIAGGTLVAAAAALAFARTR